MLGTILVAFIAFLTAIIPGFLLALALLRQTGLHLMEIIIIGFIFGLVAAPVMTWMESYLISSIHFFSFSLSLYLINTLVLTVIGLALCLWQGAFKDFRSEFLPKKGEPQQPHMGKKVSWLVWAALIIIMLSVFATRMQSIGIAPKFFEFDPYFDMVDTNQILAFGQQLACDPSAWPVPSTPQQCAVGSVHRIEPIVPYLEAYWYSLSNSLGPNLNYLSTTMMSDVGSLYPPIAAALLVFVIFMLIYHEYDEKLALIGAGLAATMPVLFTTFIAGEQLVEPWGIFALFFFFAAYMLAVKKPESKRLAIFAGLAFVSNFLGAHYYSVTAGVFAAYILAQGLVSVLRGDLKKDFYKMNAIVIAVIVVFAIIFIPYGSTLGAFSSEIPIVIIGFPIISLLAVWVVDFLTKAAAGKLQKSPLLVIALDLLSILPIVLVSFIILTSLGLAFAIWIPPAIAAALLVVMMLRRSVKENMPLLSRYAVVSVIMTIAVFAVFFTPLGSPVQRYIQLTRHFTTPSVPLFMTVQEYALTGIAYNFGAAGLGPIASSIGGFPLVILAVMMVALFLVELSIILRNSKTGVFYLAVSLIALAGFSEVKYLPHLGAVYIVLFCVMLGELAYLAENRFKLKSATRAENAIEQQGELLTKNEDINKHYTTMILGVGLFLLFSVFGLVYVLYNAIQKGMAGKARDYMLVLFFVLVLVTGVSSLAKGSFFMGEGSSYADSIGSAMLAGSAATQTQLCNQISAAGYAIGSDLYCNTIPQYWLNAMQWIRQNIGPSAPRVLSWWDYGDWINWFGNSNAVLRGDNNNPKADYAVAAQYVLGSKLGYTPQTLANMMDHNQTEYVLMDQDLIQKWSALNFLGCVHANLTSEEAAISAGQGENPPAPYATGGSTCELTHIPQMVLLPLAALVPTNSTQQSINYYCPFSNSTTQYIVGFLSPQSNATNQSQVCVDSTPNANGVLQVYTSNHTKMNAVVQIAAYLGVVYSQNPNTGQPVPFVEYMMIYFPNGPNQTITDAPTQFYSSNYYKGFMLGNLTGFHEVYPANASGINYVNGTYPVRIFALNNYTGGNAPVPQKPTWITNNYSMP